MAKKTFRFVYTSSIDIEAETEEKAREIFEDTYLYPPELLSAELRDLDEVFEVDEDGIAKYLKRR